MKWSGRRESDNVEDRRRLSGGKIAIGGGAIGIIILLINLFMGGDPNQLLQQMQQVNSGQEQPVNISPEEDEMAKYVSVALADNEDVWHQIFKEYGKEYQEPKVVLFRDATQSGCGNASSSTGPFYCPADEKVYIDLTFFDELKNRFGAEGGDFAIAYVLAHEVGHHVQHLLGTSDKVHEQQQQVSEKQANKLSVALELQADFYAGVWANRNNKMKNVLEDGDIEEALSAASAVGDDKLQKKAQGYVVPDAFTHGTSEQRMYWFKKGFTTGDITQGNTFAELGI
ncbi:MAG: neutral zinc metallopeptidase [Bacteroidetes bacterium]|jgi:predicted metalloprotease|nr:neutral zinc metallopeptidase [Bacteroidota bacterium]